MNMKSIFVRNIYLLIFILNTIECERVQRLILPTSSSILRIIPSVEMPMVTTNSINSGFNFKLPIGIQFPSTMDIVQSIRQTLNGEPINKLDSNTTRVNSRANLFSAIEKTHSRLGRVCLLRAICEVAEVPFMSASNGLIGQLVDMLLTSSALSDSFGILKIYREAERIGKTGRKQDRCKSHYKECPFSLFNIIDAPISY